jgi:phenylacetic acid degradation operon negative regulatory protein
MRIKRQLDDPRALRDPASGAVIFVFGSSGPEPRPLAGPVLVALLGALGMSEATARATILRMRRRGWLSSTRRGPVVEYALAEPARRMAGSVLAPVVGARPAWDGVLAGLLFTVPESERAYRDALRRTAVQAGFGLLRPGLLVTVDGARWARVEGVLASAPAGTRLLRAELRLDADDARTAASEAWPLEQLAATYRTQVEELRRTAERLHQAPPSGAAAVRAMWESMTPISTTAIEDPTLPSELLPRDWPGPEIRAAIESVGLILGPAVQAYFEQLTRAGSA